MDLAIDIADIVDIRDCGRSIEKFVAEELTKGPAATENDRLRLECVDLLLQNWRKRADECGYPWRQHHPELVQNMMPFGALVARASRTSLAKQLSFDEEPEHPRIQEARHALAEAKNDVPFDWTYLPKIKGTPTPGLEPPDEATAILDAWSIDDSPGLVPSGQVPNNPVAGSAALAAPTTSDMPTDRLVGLSWSQAVDAYMEKLDKKKKGARAVAEPILRFSEKFLGNPLLSTLNISDLEKLDAALPLIPGNKGFNTQERSDLHYKYLSAQEADKRVEKSEYVPISETTLNIRYREPIRKFLIWARENKWINCPDYRFEAYSDGLYIPQDREALPDGNVIDVVKLPIFTGRSTENGYFRKGNYIVQDDVYWILILLIFTGMRPSEASQLRISNIRQNENGQYFISLRTHDSSKGRVRRRDATQLKTANSARVIVIPAFIFEIGLNERIETMRLRGEDVLFPYWPKSVDKYGVIRRASKMSKMFRGIKKHCNIDAKDICLYSIRHAFADRLDSAVAGRTRDRVMGHSSGSVSQGYGAKGRIRQDSLDAVGEVNADLAVEVSEILRGALRLVDAGKLVRLDALAIEARREESRQSRSRATKA